MTKAGQRIVSSAHQALAFARGETVASFVVREFDATAASPPGADAPDVRAIRDRLGLSRSAFAERFGFGLATVRDWEHGRRVPRTTSRVLLQIIEREPEAVSGALGG